MRFSNVIATVSFAASAVDAAPRSAFSSWYKRAVARHPHHAENNADGGRHMLPPRMLNETSNSTTSTQASSAEATPDAPKVTLAVLPVAEAPQLPLCPAPEPIVKTTTLDVTIFVTAEPSSTSASTSSATSSSTSQDAETSSSFISTTVVTLQRSTESASSTATSAVETESEAVESSSSSSIISESTTSTQPQVLTTTIGNNSTVTSTATSKTSSLIEVVTSTVSVPSTPSTLSFPNSTVTSSSPLSSSSSTSSTAAIITTTTTSVPGPNIAIGIIGIYIDTAIAPISTATLTSTVTQPPKPTKTVCEHDHEAGEPDEETAYCGVSGRPAGVYFIAEFIEQRSGVAVTPEGCYQFCDSVMESTKGCQSYRFYHNEVGAPRCALYGAPVALSIYDLDETLDDLWFDLSCGSPSQDTWHTQMPVKHDEKNEQWQGQGHEQENAGSSSSSHSQASANGESNQVLDQGGAVSGHHNSLVNIGVSG